jgi:hypothetical protein
MQNFFTDVITTDPRYNSADRIDDLNLLEPTTRALVEQILASAATMGVSAIVYETYRSQERQQQLFDAGASQLRSVGVHHYGLACDIVRDVGGGEPSWKGDFSFLGQLAHSYGMIWGGDWGNPAVPHTFHDNVHVQRCSLQRQPALFAGHWYPDNAYNPYDDDRQPLFSMTLAASSGRKRPKGSRKISS